MFTGAMSWLNGIPGVVGGSDLSIGMRHEPLSPFRYEPPRHQPWVENNTGPLLPAYKSPDEVNYMRSDSHLSRAGNPALLGTDELPSGFRHSWTEDEKRPWLNGSKTTVECDLLASMRREKSKREFEWVDKLKTLTLPIVSLPEPEPVRHRVPKVETIDLGSVEREPSELDRIYQNLISKPVSVPEVKIDFTLVRQLTQPTEPEFDISKYMPKEPVIPAVKIDLAEIRRSMQPVEEPVYKWHPPEESLWSKRQKDNSLLLGVTGGETHVHDYNELGIGHVKIQSTNERFSFNNFNEVVGSKMPSWMTNNDPKPEPVHKSGFTRFIEALGGEED